jgi:hypothetical protein
MALTVDNWKSDNPKVSELMVNEVEQVLGVKLPESYISLMKKWNGGYLEEEYQVVLLNDVPENLDYYLGEGFWSLNLIAGISSDINNSEGIIYTAQTAHEWGVSEKIIAFEGNGHTWLALDYRENKDNPKVIFVETDNLLFFDLAKSFDDFIQNLIPSYQVYDINGSVIYKSGR